MADNQNFEAQPGGQRKKVAPWKMALIFAVAGVMAFMFTNRDRTTESDPGAGTTEVKGPARQSIEVQTLSEEALMEGRRLEVETLKESLRKAEEARVADTEALKKQITDMEDNVDKKLTEIVERVVDQVQSKVKEKRTAVGAGAGPANTGDVDVPFRDTARPSGRIEFDKDDEEDKKFPYRRLNAPTQPKAGSASGGGSAADDKTTVGAATLPVTREPAGSTSTTAAAPATVTPVVARKTRSRTVPAFSYVDVTTLHGVSCPVLTSISKDLGLSGKQSPVVIPVKGTFRGPNGASMNIGTVHLLALCEGVERKRATAFMTIERMSRVGSNGVSEMVKAQGYIIDSRDNEIGVRGVKVSQKGIEIAASVMATGIAAVGSALQQSSLSNSTNGVTGAVTQILDPSQLGRAMAGAAIAEQARAIAQYFREYSDNLFDVIRVEAGAPIKFINTEPIEILDELESSNVAANTGRPLL